jgi:type II secretory pathway component PulC
VSTPPFAPPVIPANPVLKVHGIAFQDGADSVAVVNGITVSNGSVIEGARVEEIQKDRVRFSRGAEKFEIILDKSN